jgi:hypothetical protein
MKNIRIGNDLIVKWSIFNGKDPFLLKEEGVTIYLKTPSGKELITDFSVSNNIITWIFYGKNQRNIGKYSLELIINKDKSGMITTDVCNFVNLVSCSCKLRGGEDSPNVETESIELTSTLEYVAGGGSYDDTAVWNELAKKVESEVVVDTESTEDFEFGYDDTEIRQEIAELSAEVGKKQDTITDLADIRSGAAKGATALQSVPDTYATKTDVSNAIQSAINNELNADF